MSGTQSSKLWDRITRFFIRNVHDGARRATAEDKTLVAKTSPTVWEYEMFRVEWTRRSVLRQLYQMLREDPRVFRANRVFAATAVRRGYSVRVTSSMSPRLAMRAQNVIDELNRRVSMNGKLAPWARVLLRDGDLFLNPVIDPASNKIVQIKSLPALTMQRNEDITGNFPDLSKAFQQIDPISLQPELELALWQVNHIRWDHEEGERYGRSQYLSALAKWKQLNMVEQDLVVRRRTRAAPKRVHIIGDKDHPGSFKDIEEYKAQNRITAGPNEIVTDYFINGLGDVKDLSADAQLDHIKDVEHLQEVYMLATGVPLHLLGFGQGVNRDIVEDQKAQFEEDVQELRGLLEYGDGGAYSGIRAIYDLALALQGIDPSLVDYSFIWYENDTDTANDRISRVIDLRSAQPDPLVSRKTALRVIGKDLGLDTDDAIEAELRQIKQEQAEDRQEQQTEAGALNPDKPAPTPLSKGIGQAAARGVLTDARESEGVTGDLGGVYLHATGNDVASPLHNNPFLDELEQHIRTFVKKQFGQLAVQYIEKNRKRIARLANVQPSAVQGIEDSVVIKLDDYARYLLTGDPHWHPVTDDERDNDNPVDEFPVSVYLYPLLEAYEQEMGPAADAVRDLLKRVYLQVGHHVRERNGVDMRVRDSQVQHLLEAIAGQRVHGIMETTRKLLARELAAAFEGQETPAQWEERIKSVLDMPDWRARMIARTEVANAYATNLMQVYRETGVTAVRWLAVIDDRTCMTCRSRNQQIYPITEVPPLPVHPNCRCTVVAVQTGGASTV